MSFQPAVPLGGTAGWQFLVRTREPQRQAFEASPAVSRLTNYFEDKIGRIGSASELVADLQLLAVTLGAFGLDDDIESRFFIRKVLEEGTLATDSLANRLSDKRYFELSRQFGFGDVAGGFVSNPGFARDIVDRYRERQFEAAVGQQNPDMRLALGLDRDLGELAKRGGSTNGLWFTVMATPPLRAVFERAFGLPKSVGALDIDRQLEIFRQRAESRLGTADIREIATTEGMEKLRRLFLASSDLSGFSLVSARGSAALALLTAMPRPLLF